MSIGPSQRSDIAPFHVMDIVGRADALERQGRSIAHLEVGQPSGALPAPVRRAVAAAVESGDPMGYTASAGTSDLRTAIADRYARRDGVAVDPDRIVVTSGASGAALLAMTACFDSGDRVGMVEPGYPCYSAIATAVGITPLRLGVGPSTRYAPTPDQLRESMPLAGLLVAHPQNPTGTALSRERLDDLLSVAEELSCRVIVDEIYRDISFVGPLPTAVGADRGEIVISSFSKYFSMTGWRLGWMVLPDDLVDPVHRLSQNLYLAPPTVSQVAALAVLDEERRGTWDATDDISRYRTNRDTLVELAGELGADEIAPADGAFYVYAQLGDLTDSAGGSLELARHWLEGAGVAVAPGVDFDRISGDRWIRFSAAGATDEIDDAADRLARWNRRRG